MEELKTRTSILQENKIESSIEMYLSGNSQNKIAKELNISRNTLRKELKARDINPQIYINQYIKQANTEVIL
jgi:DNA-binding transcriptional regulator LsrR (DeoR family)